MSRRDPGQWWDEAWSPVTGCTRAGAGCDNCWAERMAARFPACHALMADEHPAPWNEIHIHPERLERPLHWRKPRVVLVSMMGDLFHRDVPGEFIRDVLVTMVRSPQHAYCLLTKRHARAAEYLSAAKVLPINLRLMPSVWDQDSADAACRSLTRTTVIVERGLHAEPMLGPITLDLKHAFSPSWVVVGGENGRGARPMRLSWAMDLRDQCHAAGVRFWFKGAGSCCEMSPTSMYRRALEASREVPWPTAL